MISLEKNKRVNWKLLGNITIDLYKTGLTVKETTEELNNQNYNSAISYIKEYNK